MDIARYKMIGMFPLVLENQHLCLPGQETGKPVSTLTMLGEITVLLGQWCLLSTLLNKILIE